MKIQIQILILIVIFIACEEDSNPVGIDKIDINIDLEYTSNPMGGSFEILMINKYDNSVWYLGKEEDFPLYSIQYYSGIRWKDSGLQWCEECGIKIEFASKDSVKFNIPTPSFEEWRLGIPIFISIDDDLIFKWSNSIIN